jgi:hypothetical protein
MSDKFVCSPRELAILIDKFREKIGYFNPSKSDFQYLVSFTDKTHYENSDFSVLKKNLEGTGKSTDKLILSWVVTHEHEDNENELSITVRISNPINPFIMLQAALSQSPSDIDSLEMAAGSVSISVNGATQTASEEIFELGGRWIDSGPQPQSITKINTFISTHRGKVHAVNTWLMPIVYSVASFLFIQKQTPESAISFAFLLLCGFMLIRSISSNINSMISDWCHTSRMFSLFMLTGGDQNQQTKFSAKATNSTIKLISSVVVSFLVNLVAAIFVAKLMIS